MAYTSSSVLRPLSSARTMDLLAANPGALALYAGIVDWPAARRNIGRFLFLHPAARDIYADWDHQIRGCVARLRALAGTNPDAPDLAALIGELLLKSPEFAKLWERYEVTRRTAAQKKTFHHPQVGTITLGELKTLDTLDTGVRGGPEPGDITLENFGRPIPEA